MTNMAKATQPSVDGGIREGGIGTVLLLEAAGERTSRIGNMRVRI